MAGKSDGHMSSPARRKGKTLIDKADIRYIMGKWYTIEGQLLTLSKQIYTIDAHFTNGKANTGGNIYIGKLPLIKIKE